MEQSCLGVGLVSVATWKRVRQLAGGKGQGRKRPKMKTDRLAIHKGGLMQLGSEPGVS